ncbi:MAG: hypothetical protein KDE26_07655 [Bacteroidetes bacterium]|nr:hypothetical protein [Bacteroidota bacterium]MCB0843110.1 hypothetical protein [Bacteroidota bacterium]
MRREKHGIKMRFGIKRFILGAIVATIASGFAVKILWNALIPVLFGGPFITFFQALGIILLARILFGWGKGHGHCGHGHHCSHHKHKREYWRQKMEEKMEGMSEEEKKKFREGFMKGSKWEVNVFEVEEEIEEQDSETGPEEDGDSDEKKK